MSTLHPVLSSSPSLLLPVNINADDRESRALLHVFQRLDLFDAFMCASVSKSWLLVCQRAVPRLDCVDVTFGSFTREQLNAFDTHCVSDIHNNNTTTITNTNTNTNTNINSITTYPQVAVADGRVKLPKTLMPSLYTTWRNNYKKKEVKVVGHWSELFNKTDIQNTATALTASAIGGGGGSYRASFVPYVINEEETQVDGRDHLKDVLQKITISNKPRTSNVPRGLNNSDNKCFLNTVLQSLIGCNLFYGFLDDLKTAILPKQEYPYLQKLVRFFKEFKPSDNKQLHLGTSFTPSYFYETLNEFNPIATTWQEDAQEYLCFLLDKIHSEVLRVIPKKSDTHEENETDWQEVMTGGKRAILLNKSEEFSESLITDIFGGTFQSVVSKKGLTSSVRVEPFFCLHLDIHPDHINTLHDAIQNLTEKEKIEGYQDKGTEVPASKQLKIDKQPSVLLIHLKRFAYDRQTYVPYKVSKLLQYPHSLSLLPQWLANANGKAKPYRYRLYSVISHWGTSTIGGHYTCDIYHETSQKWIRYDDSRLMVVETTEEVLKNSNAYLLCYIKY